MKFSLLYLLFFILFAGHSEPANAFSEMVRHGYINCISCHVSPTGGGVLTPYGRELSKELLSTWGKDGENNFLYGAVKTPEWLNLGGDIRAIQTYLDTPTIREGRFIWMQADLEAALNFAKWAFVATFGRDEIQKKNISRRHYVIFRPSDVVSIRLGKFGTSYGLNIPEHTSLIKRGLGFDQGSETYDAELSFIAEDMSLFFTGLAGRHDDNTLDRDRGFAFKAEYNFSDRYKFGASYYNGTNSYSRRQLFGLHGIFGFTEHFFLLSEVDIQSQNAVAPNSEEKWGIADYQKLGYEVHQGVILFFVAEWSKLRLKEVDSAKDSYGLGLQWFPRPHIEAVGIWQKQRALVSGPNYFDAASLYLHYYF